MAKLSGFLLKFFLGAIAALLLFVTGAAVAHDTYANYGQRGYVWLARLIDGAWIQVTSTNCNPIELNAYQAVKDSTAGKSYFDTRWPSGLRMERNNNGECQGNVDLRTDIKLKYVPHLYTQSGDEYGGFNVSNAASTDWCQAYGANYPCGTHISVVELNQNRFNNPPVTGYFKRLIMHETGHSMGLDHHCNFNSIMNDGNPNCNGGVWTAVTGYLQTDREGIWSMYPNWRYQ